MTEEERNFNIGEIQKDTGDSNQLSRVYQDDSVKVDEAHGDWPLTCGLRSSANPATDNLTPPETSNQHLAHVELDGAELPCSGSSVVAKVEGEAARFENPEALETIGRDLDQSFSSQSHTDESEAGEEPIKPDRTR